MSNRTFSTVFNTNHGAPALNYIYDPNQPITGGGGTTPVQTGAWRPEQPGDLQTNVNLYSGNLSGFSAFLTGGYVGITGTTQVNVTNAVLLTNSSGTGFVNVTNFPTTFNIANTGTSVITGNVTINSGIFIPVFTGIINTGQVTIPVGVKQYRIFVESGAATVNGWTYNATTFVNGGGYDGRFLLTSSIAVGVTGQNQRVLINWET